MKERLNIGTIIRYNGDNYSIIGYDDIGYNIKIINPSDDEYTTHISYNTPIQIVNNKKLNLCELLKDRENEIFYNPLLGNVTVTPSPDGKLLHVHQGGFTVDIASDGTDSDGNMALFPSKEQRDWIEWNKENNHKIPKTWSELKKSDKAKRAIVQIDSDFGHFSDIVGKTPIEKSALALLKIHQLIEVGYGGNVSYEAWQDPGYGAWCILYDYKTKKFEIQHSISLIHLIAFQTLKQAQEFLSYPENVQLLKDYYIIYE